MKKQVSGPVIGIVIVVVLAVIGYFAWKSFAPGQAAATGNPNFDVNKMVSSMSKGKIHIDPQTGQEIRTK